jgi:hypothetical protein
MLARAFCCLGDVRTGDNSFDAKQTSSGEGGFLVSGRPTRRESGAISY